MGVGVVGAGTGTKVGAGTGAGTGARAGAGTGAIPGTTGGVATSLLPAATTLLPSTPITTLLNISSIFICRLFMQDIFLPVKFPTQS